MSEGIDPNVPGVDKLTEMQTFNRLERVWPDNEWEYMGDFLVYRGTLWLRFSTAVERRIYWVRVEDDPEVCMAWDLAEVPDLA